jgi:hypothetical protein
VQHNICVVDKKDVISSTGFAENPGYVAYPKVAVDRCRRIASSCVYGARRKLSVKLYCSNLIDLWVIQEKVIKQAVHSKVIDIYF